MDLRKLKTLIELVEASGIAELEISEGEERVRITRTVAVGQQMYVPSPQQFMTAPVASAPQAVVIPDEPAIEEGHVVKSPMVGTFYRSPSPEASAYVNVGDAIEPGQVICIIEAMKLMNEIKSEVKGKIVEMQADNAEPVEFGQVLFIIELA